MNIADVIYDNPYGGALGCWNWTGEPTRHTIAESVYTGNGVIQYIGAVNKTATTAACFGSKWDRVVSRNPSSNPSDYAISFDLRNLSPGCVPIPLSLAVLTKETDDQGHGYATQNVAQADGWVHVEFKLADRSGNWWQGDTWDLTNPNWSLKVGMPWLGDSVADGAFSTQVWDMDNLQISMVPEPSAEGL